MHAAAIAITLGQAKNAAIAAVVVLVVAAIAWAWLIKTLVHKALGALVLVVLAALVWFQRDSLQDCADKVEQNVAIAAGTARVDTTCSFFGQDVTITAGR